MKHSTYYILAGVGLVGLLVLVAKHKKAAPVSYSIGGAPTLPAGLSGIGAASQTLTPWAPPIAGGGSPYSPTPWDFNFGSPPPVNITPSPGLPLTIAPETSTVTPAILTPAPTVTPVAAEPAPTPVFLRNPNSTWGFDINKTTVH